MIEIPGDDDEPVGDDMPRLFGEGYSAILGDAFTRPLVDLNLQIASIFKMQEAAVLHLESSQRQVNFIIDSLQRQTEGWFRLWQSTIATIFDATNGYYPENWHDAVDFATPELLNRIVRDEGLPLCWIPPGPVVVRILEAESAAERREIIGRYSARIVDACEQQLDRITSPAGRRYARYVGRSIRALRDGHREASQALATNTLDTLIRRHGLKPPAKNNPPDLADFDLKDGLVLGALWATYFSYWGEEPTATVPREYRRHATAHGVSSRQYTLRNATIAVMHLTALLRWLEINGFRSYPKDFWN